MRRGFLILFLVFYPFAGAVVSYCIGRKNKTVRDYAADFITVSEFGILAYLFYSYLGQGGFSVAASLENFCGLGLHFRMDGFRLLYALIAAVMWMMTTIFSKEYFKHYHSRNRYYLFMLLTLGSIIGVFLSDDLYTTFIFFEIMSFTSYVWVAHDEKREALKAAETYLAVAVIGGLVMLMGLFMLYTAVGTLNFAELHTACMAYGNKKVIYIAGLCLLFGFGAKAGAVPLHIWLPKAHPVAPAPASALLSGILTKSGIFGILVITVNLFLHDTKWGSLLLLLGLLTMAGGAVLALASVDLKRTLACSSMSQIGFILIGVGMLSLLGEENVLAVRGTILHMVNHSLLKLVLFLSAGVVFMNLHKLNLDDIKGFGHKKPLLHFCFLVGAAGISGIPGGNGYISKTLLHESIVEYTVLLNAGLAVNPFLTVNVMKFIEFIFIVCGGLTLAYMLKLYVVLFVERNNDNALQEKYYGMKSSYMNMQSGFALLGSTILIIFSGLLPYITMNRLADMGQGFLHLETAESAIQYFSIENMNGALNSIIVGVLVYFLLVRQFMMQEDPSTKRNTKKEYFMKKVYTNVWPWRWDLEERVYRPLLLYYLPTFFGTVCRILDRLVDIIVVLLRKSIFKDSRLPHELEEGTAITHAIGSFMDMVSRLLNRTVRRKHPKKVSYEHKLAILNDELSENNTIIARSLSFGLMMFSLGLLLTLVYLLIYL